MSSDGGAVRRTRKNLDDQVCQNPGCTHENHDEFVVRARCHPTCGLDAIYSKGEGVFELCCKECGRLVMTIAVAAE